MSEASDWESILAAEGLGVYKAADKDVHIQAKVESDFSLPTGFAAEVVRKNETLTQFQDSIDAAARQNLAQTVKGMDRLAHEAMLGGFLPGLSLSFDLEAMQKQARDLERNIDNFSQFRRVVNSSIREAMQVSSARAAQKVEEQRLRRGWAERSNYPDRHGRHHLGAAIIKSVSYKDEGEFTLGYFNPTVLDRGTNPDGTGKTGYWRAYEFGRHFIMPWGFWVGPSGRRYGTPTAQARGLKAGRAERKAAATAGLTARGGEQFRPGHVHGAQKNVYATIRKRPILQRAIEEAGELAFQLIQKEAKELLIASRENFNSERATGYATGGLGHGSVAASYSDLGDPRGD